MTKIQEITTREKQICFLLSQWREKEAKALSDLNAKEISKMGGLWKSGIGVIHLINRCAVYMNASRFDVCRKLLDKLYTLKLDDEKRYICLDLDVELNHRAGNPQKALELVLEAEKLCDTPSKKVMMLIHKGFLETELTGVFFNVNSFSDALRVAEESGDQFLIARVYTEMNGMFYSRYPGIGIYFLRKAEVIYRKVGERHHLTQVWMYLAFSLATVYDRTPVKENECFRQEAERIVYSITEEQLVMPSDFAFYNRVKGFVLKDEDFIEKALDYYLSINAVQEVARTVDMYMSVSLNNRHNEKALAKMPIYKDYVCAKHGAETMAQADRMERMILNGESMDYEPASNRPQPGDPTTLFDILDHLSLGEERWYLNRGHFTGLFPTYKDEGNFTSLVMPDNKIRLVPNSLSFNDYYRGQTEFHDPCQPTLHRGYMTPAMQFVERVKYKELCLLMESYPLFRKFQEGLTTHFSDSSTEWHELFVDNLALAQHYGICTELIDLTVDKFVAAFFACTDYDYDTDTYSVHDENKPKIVDGKEVFVTEGCFYMYVDTHIGFGGDVSQLRSVGLQPFSRPGEQAGYVLEMLPADNFNGMVRQCIHFKHDKKIAEFIFNYTNRSNKLFPQSVLQEKAMTIKKSKEFSREAFNLAKNEFYPDTEEQTLLNYLENQNVTLQDDRLVSFSEEEIDRFNREWEEHGSEDFLKRVFFRTTYSGPMEIVDDLQE